MCIEFEYCVVYKNFQKKISTLLMTVYFQSMNHFLNIFYSCDSAGLLTYFFICFVSFFKNYHSCFKIIHRFGLSHGVTPGTSADFVQNNDSNNNAVTK